MSEGVKHNRNKFTFLFFYFFPQRALIAPLLKDALSAELQNIWHSREGCSSLLKRHHSYNPCERYQLRNPWIL